MKIIVTGIKWDADDMEDVLNIDKDIILKLPTNLFDNDKSIEEFQDTVEEFVSDEISNISGFTHDGWENINILY
jgi:hypothetical protein